MLGPLASPWALATVFFETAASALFLARFGSARLPYVYVAAAAPQHRDRRRATRASQDRVPFARLMTGTLWFLLVTWPRCGSASR